MNVFRITFLILYVLSGYVFTLDVVDKISFQWLFLSILNFLALIHFSYNDKTEEQLVTEFFKTKISLVFSAFILFSLSTYFYAINQNEVLINFFRWLNVFVSFYIFYIILIKVNNARLVISNVIIFGLILELLANYSQIFILYDNVPYDFSLASKILGLAANKNINAASIITKLPFVFYLFLVTKREIIKFFSLLIIFFSIFILIYVGARASIISLIAVIFFLIVSTFYLGLKRNNLIKDLKRNLLPIIISISCALIISNLMLGTQNSANINNRISTISADDKSVSLRLGYYKQAFNHFIKNPFIGVGLGNWKLKSIDYDNKTMTGYIVQYHAHNDFLQFLAELGIIGTLLYLGLFILILVVNLKFLLSTRINDAYFSLVLILSLGAYFIDANLNFPYARVINQIVFISILSGTLIQSKIIANE